MPQHGHDTGKGGGHWRSSVGSQPTEFVVWAS
jgi:hypothetical protein